MENPFERELEIARQIQSSFLPEEFPQFPGWEIAAYFQPARQVAGDFYDAFPLVQNRRLGLVIGDVCDKGVGAALFMALFRTLIRAFAQQHYTLRWMSDWTEEAPDGERRALPSVGTSALKNAMELTNDYIANTHGNANMFATLFFGVLDPASGALMYVNGGHTLPLIVNSAGIKTELATTGPAVGMFPAAHFEIREARLEPGDALIAFTDGVTDAQNPDEEQFGDERFRALLARPFSTAAELLDRIQASLQVFSGGADPADDITWVQLSNCEHGCSAQIASGNVMASPL
jgi:sigma-B regulation protein RsbU (phosphoserine phosphatase)